METRHIKIDYNEAVFAKKQLLKSEIDTLNVLRKFKNYKILRKKENSLKNKLKTSITSLKTKTKLIHSSFPKEETEKIKKMKRKIHKEPSKHNEINYELEEIKAKLAKLEN